MKKSSSQPNFITIDDDSNVDTFIEDLEPIKKIKTETQIKQETIRYYCVDSPKYEDNEDVMIIDNPKAKTAKERIQVKKEEIIKIEEEEKELVSTNSPVILWINRLDNYPKDKLWRNMISFEQLISEDLKENSGKKSLQTAFMTCCGFHLEQLLPILDQGTRLTLADNWKNTAESKIKKSFCGRPNFTYILPPKDPAKSYGGTFHPKLWLLKFPTFLRVVISSANLTTWDWSIWSNCIWFKDFPKKTPKNTLNPPKGLIRNGLDFNHDFRMTLASFVQSLMPIKIQYPELIGIDIDDYLISGIDIILIPSVPGKYSGKEFERYGHSKIGAMVRKFYPCEPNNPNNYLLPKKAPSYLSNKQRGKFQ